MIVTVWPFPTHKRMTVYTVHEQPEPAVDRIDRADELVFLKDGFTWSAFLLGPIWLLANKLWLATLGYVVVAALAYLLFDAFGAVDTLFSAFVLALNMIVGFEAHWFKSAKFEATGWNSLGSVTGRGLTDCERRFFERWLPSQSMLSGSARADSPSALQPGTQEHSTDTGAPGLAENEAKSKSRRGFAFFRRSREG